VKLCPTCGQQWPDEQKFCPNDGSALKTSGTSDLVGSVIAGNYHIEKKLGEGGMGAVYLGQHVKMGRKSAIKVMTQSMAHDPDAIARFNREATNAARINHPNVCAIYDFGETPDGLIYLAMEFIEGESLSDLLEREGALSPKRAATVFQQAGDALQAAHDLGIVHRDLKPDNIMLTKAKSGADVVKVVDFGIAKAVGGEEGQKVTKTGLVVGTPEYMSPEQLAGDKLDGRSDIYSLALVLYRMLTGTLPFQADNAQEVMIKRLTDEPMPLSAARPDIPFPEPLQAVMDRALRRMPAERYGSAAEMARDVTQAVSGMADAAPGVDTEGATQLISAQPKTNIAATRVGGGEAAPTARLQRARAPTPDTPTVAAQPPALAKKKPVMAIAAAVTVLVVGGGTAALMLSKGGAKNAPSVTQNTAQTTPPAALSSQPTGNPTRPEGNTRTQHAQPSGAQPTTTAPANVTQPPRPTVDTAAVNKDLGEMIDQIFEASTRATARQRAQGYYDNPDVPVTLRAQAAFLVAQAFFAEQRVSDACRWNALALELVPANPQYQRFKRDQNCQ
jgi:serine/threonine-protein kinase